MSALLSCLLIVAAAQEPTRRMQPGKAFLRQVHLHKSSSNATPIMNPFQRVWMVCKQKQPQLPTTEEMAADMETLEPANCTDEMPYESLCCARWEDKDFKHPGLMMLSRSQYNASGGTIASGGEVIKVCTQAVNGMALMSQAHSDAANMPVECTNADITAEQLRGESDGLQPGEIVLRTRLLYFASQQIPMDSVPKCETEVATCSDGKNVTSVQPAWLEKVQAENQPQLGGVLVQVAEGNMFAGALLTSGSFTMMASSAF